MLTGLGKKGSSEYRSMLSVKVGGMEAGADVTKATAVASRRGTL